MRQATTAAGARLVRALMFIVFASIAGAAGAWSNHALGSWPALAAMPELKNAAPVKVESLADFVSAEAAGLAKLLRDEEQWARLNVPNYPPRPDALAFQPRDASADELVKRFVVALRINPESRLNLFVQLPPGQSPDGRATLAESEVTTLKHSDTTKSSSFIKLKAGDLVPVVDVAATASDEPDYGLDIGLWTDNGTVYGKTYGFGTQPFGNPALEFSSQAPLHMGFFHESAIIYKAAPFLQRTYPEYRIHLWQSLASYALRTGHPYWGWRFAGWALHYIQDLTQPYHARVLPAVGVTRMLWINALDIVGIHTPKNHAITFVSNRHLSLENYQLRRLRQAYVTKQFDDPALRALRDTAHDPQTRYQDDSPRQLITLQSSGLADALDATLVARLPHKYTSDPDYEFDESAGPVDLYAEIARSNPSSQQAVTQTLVPLLENFGTHSRAFVRTLLRNSH